MQESVNSPVSIDVSVFIAFVICCSTTLTHLTLSYLVETTLSTRHRYNVYRYCALTNTPVDFVPGDSEMPTTATPQRV